jgi:AAA ATPase domain
MGPRPLVRFSSYSSDFILACMEVGFSGLKFIGRAEELGRLLAVLEQIEEGPPATVLMAGDVGIGKSRLLAEFCGQAEQREAQILVGGCLQVGDGGLPYVPVVIALRRFASDAANEESSAAAAKGLPGLERLLSELAGPTAEEASEAAPGLVVVEDLHWTDRSTRDLLAFLGRTFALLPYHPRPFTDHVLTTWGLGANWACFQARLAEPFPEAPSRERCGRDRALARGSDVATGRPPWKDDPGLGHDVTEHDPSQDRDVEVVMAGCCGRLEEGTYG